MRLAKSCRESNPKKIGRKKAGPRVNISTPMIRKDGSKITDPWEVVDDH